MLVRSFVPKLQAFYQMTLYRGGLRAIPSGRTKSFEGKKKWTNQGETRLVLVEGPDSGPIERLKEFDAGSVECVLAGHDPEEVGVSFPREHGVSVRIRQLFSFEKRRREVELEPNRARRTRATTTV